MYKSSFSNLTNDYPSSVFALTDLYFQKCFIEVHSRLQNLSLNPGLLFNPTSKLFNARMLKQTKNVLGSGKSSVMERVTNVFCGGSGSVAYMNLQSANNANATPEKPSRSATQSINSVPAGNNKERLNNVTPSRTRIPRNRVKIAVPLASGGTGGYVPPSTWEQLMQDDNFLARFFLYFNATERRILAQVRETLYLNIRLR